jgi:hypothetical protein
MIGLATFTAAAIRVSPAVGCGLCGSRLIGQTHSSPVMLRHRGYVMANEAVSQATPNIVNSIDEVSSRVLGGSRLEASSMDPLKCQTSTATRQSRGSLADASRIRVMG